MVLPAFDGIHHLKVHVSDPRRSARWYERVLGYEPALEFVERDQLVGYGMSHRSGGTLLTLRLDPEGAAVTAGRVYFEMGLPDKDGLDRLADHLDTIGETHGPVVRTPIGWLLPGVHDPDGHQMRFYASDPAERPDATRPRRIHDAGTPAARLEPLAWIDLDGEAVAGDTSSA